MLWDNTFKGVINGLIQKSFKLDGVGPVDNTPSTD